MRIELRYGWDLPGKNVSYLTDSVIRFELEAARQPSEYQRFLLGELAGLDQIFPEAPNREAVAHNARMRKKQLLSIFRVLRGRPFGASGAISTPVEALRFLLDHYCRPAFLITNNVAVISVVRRDSAVWECVDHLYVEQFVDAVSWYGDLASLGGDEIWQASSLEDVEKIAVEKLGNVEPLAIRTRRGEESSTLMLRCAGRVSGRGGPIATYIASFRGKEFIVQAGNGPWSKQEPFRVWNELILDGFRLEVCATCTSFRFRGMSRDMSGGARGYCATPPEGMETMGTLGLTSVKNYCPKFQFVEESKRYRYGLDKPAPL